jgi:KUP system potassium uptake protein
MPALVLNYFGQGALLLAQPEAIRNPFYLALPSWALYPMVGLATAATVIASQATISGAYSMTRQAIQLGYLPRMSIVHTSARTIGQVYVPAVNWALALAVAAAVIGFGSSSRLASAYGIAVIGTMLVTTLLSFFVVRFAWRMPLWVAVCATAAFLVIDASFLAAALRKVADGGAFPLLIAGAMFVVMVTWRQGRDALLAAMRAGTVPLREFLDLLSRSPPQRVEGTAVFLTSTPDATPNALPHSLKHYGVLHARNVFLTVQFEDVPAIGDGQRVSCEPLGADAWRVGARYGFMEQPDVATALELCGPSGLDVDPAQVSYFLSREKIVPRDDRSGIAGWRHRLFAGMARNAGSITDFFNVPTNRVVELGTRVEL